MAAAQEKRRRILDALRVIDNDIQILLIRINKVRVAEATLDDDAFEDWIKQNGDLEEGLATIRLF